MYSKSIGFALATILIWPSAGRAQTPSPGLVPPPPPPPAAPPPAPSSPLLATPARLRTPRIRRRRIQAVRRPCLKSYTDVGVYADLRMGSFSFAGATGAYRFLTPGFSISPYFGVHFLKYLGMELGMFAAFPGEKDKRLGDIGSLELLGMTVDFKLRLVVPNRLRRWSPYLMTGLGVYFLQGKSRTEAGCLEDKPRRLAHGGGLRVGAGIDFFPLNYLSVGIRGMYNAMFMSQIYCGGALADRCARMESDGAPTQHGFNAEVVLALYLPI